MNPDNDPTPIPDPDQTTPPTDQDAGVDRTEPVPDVEPRSCWSCGTEGDGYPCEGCGANARPEEPIGVAEWRDELVRADDPQAPQKGAVLDAVEVWERDGRPMTSDAAQSIADAARDSAPVDDLVRCIVCGCNDLREGEPCRDCLYAAQQEAERAEAKAPTYRVLGTEKVYVDHRLTTDEKLAANESANKRGEALLDLQASLEAAQLRWNEDRAELKAKIDDAEDAWKSALRARHTGIERRGYTAERRADIPTATVQLVRLDSMEVVESRAMTSAEQAKYCRQGDIEDLTKGATVKATVEQPKPEPTALAEAFAKADEKKTEKAAKDERDKDGWPVAWMAPGKSWSIPLGGGETMALTEPDVRQVYIVVPSEGTGLKLAEVAALAPLAYLPKPALSKALALLETKRLAVKGMGMRWLTTPPGAKPAPEPQPGRADALPESDVQPSARKMTEPETKADALIADAVESGAGWKPVTL